MLPMQDSSRKREGLDGVGEEIMRMESDISDYHASLWSRFAVASRSRCRQTQRFTLPYIGVHTKQHLWPKSGEAKRFLMTPSHRPGETHDSLA